MSTLTSIPRPSAEVVDRITRALRADGLQVTCSFDLQSARAALVDPGRCPCPHHGTASCTCQYLILLVSERGSEPVSLVVHGHDDQTYLSLAEPPGGTRDGKLEARLLRRIDELTPSTSSGG